MFITIIVLTIFFRNSLSKPPDLRPKGLGLGANRQIKENKPKSAVDKNGKELILIKGAFAKIIAGANKGHYCEVQGLDDEGSRVIVKTSLKNEILNVNEFLLVPVTKEEFAKGCKVISKYFTNIKIIPVKYINYYF